MAEYLKHLTRTQQFDYDTLKKLLVDAAIIKNYLDKEDRGRILKEVLRDKSIINLFWGNSRRTLSDFTLAGLSMGADVVFQEYPANPEAKIGFSSVIPHDNFADNIIDFGSKYDCLVLRTPMEGQIAEAVKISKEYGLRTSVINAGGGRGQHPIQALCDYFTLEQELGGLKGKSIGFIGDLSFSRTVHSLIYLLTPIEGIKMYFISPRHLVIPSGVMSHIKENHINATELTGDKISSIKIDALYVVSVSGKFKDQEEEEQYMPYYTVDRQMLEKLGGCDVFHPLPRGNELPSAMAQDINISNSSIDHLPQAKYFIQSRNRIFVIMSVLKNILAFEINLRNKLELEEKATEIIAQCTECNRLLARHYKADKAGWTEEPQPEHSVAKTHCPKCRPKKA